MAYPFKRIWRVKPTMGLMPGEMDLCPDVLCLPLNEYGGLNARDYSTRSTGATSSATVWAYAVLQTAAGWSQGKNGNRLSLQNTGSAYASMTAFSRAIPTSAVTVMFGQRKRDSTNRVSATFGVNAAANSARCGSHCPYSDGTIYFDFGGQVAGTTRITFAGATFGDDIFAMTVGGRGMEIWQNGVLLASNSATPTRTQTDEDLQIGIGNGVTTSDLVDIDFLYIWSRQIPTALIQRITADPWAMFTRRDRGFKIAFAGAGAAAFPYVDPYIELLPQ